MAQESNNVKQLPSLGRNPVEDSYQIDPRDWAPLAANGRAFAQHIANLCDEFRSLFAGNADAHYILTGPRDSGGRYESAERSITTKDALRHLAGRYPSLLSIPIMKNGNVNFALIDVDRHKESDEAINCSELSQKVTDAKLPLVVCRSRGGKGCWLVLFFREPDGFPAADARRLLEHYVEVLELKNENLELFPKQDKIGKIGSGVNLPCFGMDRPAFGPLGEELDTRGFIDLAQERSSFGKVLLDRLSPSTSQPQSVPTASNQRARVVSPKDAIYEIGRQFGELLYRLPQDGQDRDNALTRAALMLGNYVGAKAIPMEIARQHLLFAANLLQLKRSDMDRNVDRLLNEGIKNGGVQLRDLSLVWHTLDETVMLDKKPSFVSHLIYQGVHTSLVAKPKVGKTTFLLDASESIIFRRPFLKNETTPTSILYVTEQPLASFQPELQNSGLICPRSGSLFSQGDNRFGNFEYITTEQWWKIELSDLIELVGEKAVKSASRLVIFDTFSRIARVKDEKDASEMQSAVDKLTPLLAAGIGTVLVQHERKMGGDIMDAGRGTGAITGAVDVVIRLIMVGGKYPNQREMQAVGRLPLPAQPLMLNRRTADEGSRYELLGVSGPVKVLDLQSRILQLWASNGNVWLSEEEITQSMNEERSSCKRAIVILVKDGLLEQRGEGKKGKPYEYHEKKKVDEETIRHF